jgi:hypothetical protein
MWAGRTEQVRGLLMSHGWVIGRLFSKDRLSEGEHESFIRYGSAGNASPEPRIEAVEEKVAEILRTGVVRFDG